MNIWHLGFSTDGRHPLFSSEQQRRAGVRALVRVAGRDMALFSLVDDHVHAAVIGDRQRKAYLCRTILVALRKITSTGVLPAHVKPVLTRRHMQWLVTYLLTQVTKHGLRAHPATWTGSCFPDLIGARRLPGLELRLEEALPRYRLRDAQGAVGLTSDPLKPYTDEQVRLVGTARLANAAAAAGCVGPNLSGRTAEVVAIRRAVAGLGVHAGLAARDIGLTLGISPHTVRRLGRQSQDAALHDAVRLRLHLEDLAATHAPTSQSPSKTLDPHQPDGYHPRAFAPEAWPSGRRQRS